MPAHVLLQYGSDASAARDAQQYLLEAHRQARQKELELLVAADAGVAQLGLAGCLVLPSLQRPARTRSASFAA
jgi:hypothetical protein